MNKNRFLLAIIVLLALNLVALVVHTIVLRGRTCKTIPGKPEVSQATSTASLLEPKPPLVTPPKPQPIRLEQCEQVSMSSNRLAKVRLLFNGPVETNSLASRLSFKAVDTDVAFVISHVATNLQTVVVDLLTPIPGSLVTATLGEGTLPAPESTLFLPSSTTAKVGCALSPGLAVQDVGADQGSFGSASIKIQFNQQTTAADAKRFIHVTPSVDFSVSVASRSYWEEDESILVLKGDFKPGRKYKLSIDGGLRAHDGEILVKPYSREVSIPSLAPACKFASEGRYLAPSDDFVIPLKAVNITNVEIHAEHLLPANIVQFVMRETNKYDNWYNWERLEEANAELLTVERENISIPVNAKRNDETVVPYRLGGSSGKGDRGAYLVTVIPTSDMGNVEVSHRVICASDIGLSLLLEDDGGIAYVWVTTLSTGAARPGVAVALRSDRNELLGEAVSDASGLAKIKFDAEKEPVAVVGSDPNDGDLTFLPIADKSNVAVVQPGKSFFVDKGEYEAFVFTDRGIYRPGETVFLQALLRDNQASAPAQAFPVELKVFRPNGKLFRKMTLMPDARGSIKAEISIPEYLPSGHYNAEVRVPGNGGALCGYVYFLVESFVPPQIKVAVKASQETAAPGEKLSATVSAEHLYGAPAEGLRAESGVSFLPLDFKPDGWERFTFGDRNVKFNGGAEKNLGAALLDADGRRTLSFEIPGDLRAPARA